MSETDKAVKLFLADRLSFTACIAALDSALEDLIPRLNPDEKEFKRPPASEKEFLIVLIQDVVTALTLRNEAQEAFNKAIGQFPGGLPHPDGSQRIKNTSSQLSSAQKRLATAHNRLDDFLSRGIVPVDLRQRSGS